MTEHSHTNGLSHLSKLDQYWIRRSVKPAVLPNERLLSISSEHWIKYVFPSILYILLSGLCLLPLYLAMVTPAAAPALFQFLVLIGLLLLFCVHHWFFWFLLAESQACIIVTSKRVVYLHSGLLWNEEMIEVAYEKMKTVEAHKKTLLQSILNFGTLQFEPIVKIHRVPHPGTLARQIEQTMGMI